MWYRFFYLLFIFLFPKCLTILHRRHALKLAKGPHKVFFVKKPLEYAVSFILMPSVSRSLLAMSILVRLRYFISVQPGFPLEDKGKIFGVVVKMPCYHLCRELFLTVRSYPLADVVYLRGYLMFVPGGKILLCYLHKKH